jgi:His Kinase A (phospho-acceptor) domain
MISRNQPKPNVTGRESSSEASLKRYVLQFVLVLGTVLVLIYTVLVRNYFYRGLDEAMTSTMELEAVRFKKLYEKDPNTPLPQIGRIKSTWNFSALPKEVQNELPTDSHRHRLAKVVFYCELDAGCDFEEGIMTGVLIYDVTPEKRLYVLSRYDGHEYSEEQSREWSSRLINALLISVAPIVIVIAYAFFLVWRIIQPMRHLAQWTQRLDEDQIRLARPNFRFAELNLVADHLKESFERISQVVEREHRFLSTASHELRTPITVVSSNLELLNKLQPSLSEQEKAPLTRIHSAAINMKQLSRCLRNRICRRSLSRSYYR